MLLSYAIYLHINTRFNVTLFSEFTIRGITDTRQKVALHKQCAVTLKTEMLQANTHPAGLQKIP